MGTIVGIDFSGITGAQIVIDISISVLTGILTSGLFLWFLYKIKPDIEISDKISKTTLEDGTIQYKFKIINKGTSPIYDIKAELSVSEPYNVEGGTNIRYRFIKLNKDNVAQIQGYDKKSNNALHCIIFVTNQNIDEKWNTTSQSLRFVVLAKHAVTGFGKVFVKDYFTKSTIKNGTFKFGNSFDIV